MFWLILIMALICAPIAGSIYGRKGYSAVAGFIVGLVFGPLGLLLVAIAKPNWNEMQRCPRCRGLNGRHKQRCQECGSALGHDAA